MARAVSNRSAASAASLSAEFRGLAMLKTPFFIGFQWLEYCPQRLPQRF